MSDPAFPRKDLGVLGPALFNATENERENSSAINPV
jgi:hypothetical protein